MNPICNICGSKEQTKAYDTSMKLYRCIHCDHTFTLIDEKYDTKDIYADEYFDSSHKNWFLYPNYALFQYIHRMILKHSTKHDFRLLDIGCGRGDLLSFLHKMEPSADLNGIDGAPCASRDFKFIQDDFMKTVMQDHFDVITSLMCIEHVDNPELFIRKIKNLTRPDGLIVITTINSGGMMYGMARFFNKIGIHSAYKRLYSEHHIHHFTNKSLRLLLEKRGLSIVSQKNHNYNLASVDFPPAGPVIIFLYKVFTAIIFFLSSIFKNGMSQTVVCVPEGS